MRPFRSYTHQPAIGHRTRFQPKVAGEEHVRRRAHISFVGALHLFSFSAEIYVCQTVAARRTIYTIVWMVCLYTAICVHRIFSLLVFFFLLAIDARRLPLRAFEDRIQLVGIILFSLLLLLHEQSAAAPPYTMPSVASEIP